jgi:hypothetical protein
MRQESWVLNPNQQFICKTGKCRSGSLPDTYKSKLRLVLPGQAVRTNGWEMLKNVKPAVELPKQAFCSGATE